MNKITYYIQKLDGQPPVKEWGSNKPIDDFWNTAPAGRYTVEIKRIPKKKTWKQCKAIFGVAFQNIIAQANDLGIDVSYLLKYLLQDNIPKGQGLTTDFLIELAYIICPTNDEEGHRITLSKMSTVQAMKLYEGLQNIFAPIGINIPDPDPEWFKKQSKETVK
jgi:hypothetical protein